ncbi:hypothetical protein [Mycobacterium palustre]|uniref:hypothetical protein n=2 Tax=Mycobacterium palustre TaxID=153971 RepID=UPI001150BA2A|nr:hypothetical protein [Mycobacterium palustre]
MRIGYGVVLLAVPDPVLHLVSGQVATVRGRAVTRFLGLRLLAQGAVTAVAPDAATLAVSAETDLVHAATMLAWAAVDRRSRRLTLFSGALAALFGAADVVQARRAPSEPPRAAGTGDLLPTLVRLRHRAATHIVRHTLPGGVRAGGRT